MFFTLNHALDIPMLSPIGDVPKLEPNQDGVFLEKTTLAYWELSNVASRKNLACVFDRELAP